MKNIPIKALLLSAILISSSIKTEQEKNLVSEQAKSNVYTLAGNTALALGTGSLIAGGLGTLMRCNEQIILDSPLSDIIDSAKWCSWLVIPGTVLTIGSIAYLMKHSKGPRAKMRSLWGSLNTIYGTFKIALAAAGAGTIVYMSKQTFINPRDLAVILTVLSFVGIEGLFGTINGYCLQPDNEVHQI